MVTCSCIWSVSMICLSACIFNTSKVRKQKCGPCVLKLHADKQIIKAEHSSRSLVCVANRHTAGANCHRRVHSGCSIHAQHEKLLYTASKQSALRLSAHYSSSDNHIEHHNSSFVVTVLSALGYTVHGLVLPLKRAFEQTITLCMSWRSTA